MEDKTLEYYEKYAEDFYRDTVYADVTQLYQMFLDRLPLKARILDLGCGSGRDSKYFKELGYEVTAIDGSPELCRLASLNIGQQVICTRFTEINYQNAFDGIWACASLLHVPAGEINAVLEKINKALAPKGILYASFKYGNGERNKDGRYFNDCTEEKAAALLADSGGWSSWSYYITKDVRTGRGEEAWLNIIAVKE